MTSLYPYQQRHHRLLRQVRAVCGRLPPPLQPPDELDRRSDDLGGIGDHLAAQLQVTYFQPGKLDEPVSPAGVSQLYRS